MASLTRWTWVCVNSRSWWWTGRPGVLQFMGLQRVGHNWATDLIWSERSMYPKLIIFSKEVGKSHYWLYVNWYFGRKVMTNQDSILQSKRHYFVNKGPSRQGYGFSNSHVWMWELDYKESWAPKNWCFWTVVLKKTLGSPLDCKEIQPVHPKEDQSWVFIGRTDAEAETPILWPPHEKSWLIWKDPDAGKDWGQEEKGTTEDEMVGWHHRLNGHGFGWTLAVGDGQGGLACCGSWAHKELDTVEQLNWTELKLIFLHLTFFFFFFTLPSLIL